MTVAKRPSADASAMKAAAPVTAGSTGHDQPRSGVGEAVDVSMKLAGVAASLTRRLTVDLAGQAFVVGKEVVEGARDRRPAGEIATGVVMGLADGARHMLGVDQDIEKAGEQLNRIAKPVSDAIPGPMKSAVESVASLTPLRAMTGLAGVTVQEVRWNLKAQGMELLKRSTALDDPEEHPALARILTEISPDEARIIRFLATTGPHAVVDVVAHNPMTRKRRELVHNFSIVGRESGCIRPHYTPIYLDNLARLGVVVVRDYRLRSQPNYDLLYCQPEVQDVKKPEGRIIRLKIVHKGVELSDFGKVLYQNCLETPGYQICAVPDKL
ncbi:MAG: DUF4393 domain-containing protein [Actinophytocola sp.]|nr:DUF4393 domain-containing protein [Actinophytocola sp.]